MGHARIAFPRRRDGRWLVAKGTLNRSTLLKQVSDKTGMARKEVEQVTRKLGNADFLECPDLDSLVVSEARVDGGPTFKRMQPRARGTAFMIKRRLAHIHVTLSDPLEETPAVHGHGLTPQST